MAILIPSTWTAYALDSKAQEVSYAFAAQASVAAESKVGYSAPKKPARNTPKRQR